MALAPRVFLTAEQIQNRVRQMGEEISANYPEGPLYLISILKGAFMFLADFRAISRHLPASSSWAFRVTAAARRPQAR
jgi:hypoxanthine-guanine phosphoribosyltransferase